MLCKKCGGRNKNIDNIFCSSCTMYFERMKAFHKKTQLEIINKLINKLKNMENIPATITITLNEKERDAILAICDIAVKARGITDSTTFNAIAILKKMADAVKEEQAKKVEKDKEEPGEETSIHEGF